MSLSTFSIENQNQNQNNNNNDIIQVSVDDLTFGYGGPKVLSQITFNLNSGSRCLLVGANGAGKTTLLKILAGKHLLTKDNVKIMSLSPYHNCPNGLTFLGGDWAHNPLVRKDISVQQLLNSINSTLYQERCNYLLELLDINIDWKMHTVSDGERRRVQLLLGLLKPFKVLLLDEITVDLDVLVRQDLLAFLQQESEINGATIIYATHIFDGLDYWPTHLLHLGPEGRIIDLYNAQQEIAAAHSRQIQEKRLQNRFYSSPLLYLVESWLRLDLERKRKAKIEQENQNKQTLLQKLSNSSITDKYYNYWN
eukprot:TRINITY_DN139_c2_g3_i1.p1 TRINITY_DN139_c2_g3~~TRINITY_DN139_c2_g3_i1.p1  ORF type:complete len:309 (-),score=128.46 TRINITY_DN139_c2_g3_i1:88-1014(-)